VSLLDAALEYLDRGWCVIPIRPETKRPPIKWLEYQRRLPTEEEITRWWTDWPECDVAIVTGAISGHVVVDCDNEDALHAAYDAGMRSPVRVRTKRGTHLYFRHPMDGVRRGPRAGCNVRAVGADWPRINGLDFRGDGSYALLPPSRGYTWDVAAGHDLDDTPVWQDWRPKLAEGGDGFDFEALDLTDVRPLGPDEFVSEWDRAAKFVRDHFPSSLKIPTGFGNGRNERVMRYISECLLEGVFGAELRVRGYAFMREFFAEPLPEPEYQATVRSMEDAERRNHPERFDEKGDYIYRRTPPATVALAPRPAPGGGGSDSAPAAAEPPRRLIRMADAERMLAESAARRYLIEPWLPPASITQVYGYSGHGKSMFVQHAMTALTAGAKYFGPFEIGGVGKVLYLDWEMGQRTIARRLLEMRGIHGDAQDRLQIWTPFLGIGEMNLKSKAGLLELQGVVQEARPDVVVIDTVRSAFPGLQENSAEEWGRINSLAVRLRNAGMAVVMVHHANKPGETGMGREAGSTNQLTVLETQIRITQVYEDEETALQNAGIYDGARERPVWPLLRAKLPDGFQLYMVMEVRYGKVREWTDEHDRVQWIGYAQHTVEDQRMVVSSRSTKQVAKDLALEGVDPGDIADRLGRSLRVVREWLEVS
jgi:hypothetical protein